MLAINVTMESERVTLDVSMVMTMGESCDDVKGNYISGSAVVIIDDEGGRTLEASLRGTKHCPGHPSAMRALGREPEEVAPQHARLAAAMRAVVDGAFAEEDDVFDYDALAPSDAPNIAPTAAAALALGDAPAAAPAAAPAPDPTADGEKGNDAAAAFILSGGYSEYELLMGVYDFEIVEGLKIESATMSLRSISPEYNTSLSDVDWAFEVYGKASFTKRVVDLDGMAATFEVAAKGTIVDGGDNVSVAVIVNASLDMTLGDGVRLSGSVAVAVDAASRAEAGGVFAAATFSLKLPALGTMLPQTVTAAAVLYEAGTRSDGVLARFRVEAFDGVITMAMFKIESLSLEGTVVRNSTGRDANTSLIGTLKGSVSISGGSMQGMVYGDVFVSIDTRAERYVVDFSIAYQTTAFGITASAQISLGECDPKGWIFGGSFTATLGDAGQLSASAAIVRHCEENATAVHGYLYHLRASVEAVDIQVGGGTVSLERLEADFYGVSVGGADGGRAVLVWRGSLIAAVSIGINKGKGKGLPPALVPSLVNGDGGSGVEISAGVDIAVRNSTLSELTANARISYISPDGNIRAEIAASYSWLKVGGGSQSSIAANGTLSIAVGALKIPKLSARFLLLFEPDANGMDLSVSLDSGEEEISIGETKIGTFTLVAQRFDETSDAKKGWVGTLVAKNKNIGLNVFFDTRTGDVSIEAVVTIDFGPLEVEISGKWNKKCAAAMDGASMVFGLSFYMKKFPGGSFKGTFKRFCNDASPNVWEIEGLAESWQLTDQIALTMASVRATCVRTSNHQDDPSKCDVTVSFSAELAFGSGLPGADAILGDASLGGSDASSSSSLDGGMHILGEINGTTGAFVFSVDGEFSLRLNTDGTLADDPDKAPIALDGSVHLEYPCEDGASISLALLLDVNINAIVVNDAGVSAVYYCGKLAETDIAESGGGAETLQTRASFSASIDLVQIGKFSVVDVSLDLLLMEDGNDPARDWRDKKKYLDISLQGTVEISTFAISAAVSFKTAPDLKKPKVVVDITMEYTKDMGGGRTLQLTGHGRLDTGCSNVDDAKVSVRAKAVTGLSFMPVIDAEGSLEANCAFSAYSVKVKVAIGAGSSRAQVGPGVKVPLAAILDFEYAALEDGSQTITVSYTFGSLRVFIGVEFLSTSQDEGGAGAGEEDGDDVNLILGIHIQKCTIGEMFRQVDDFIPDKNIGGANPVDGSTAEEATVSAISAQLGGGGGGVGKLKERVSKMVIPNIKILFQYNTRTGGMELVISITDAKLFGVGLDAFIVVDFSADQTKAFAYLGITSIEDGLLAFDAPMDWLSDVLNVPIKMMGGGLTSLGIRYATDHMVLSNATRAYAPVKIDSVRKGIGLHVVQDLSMSTNPSGLAGFMLSLLETVAGDCGKKDKKALAELMCEGLTPEARKDFNLGLDFGNDVTFYKTFTTTSDGIPVTDPEATVQFRWMSLTIGFFFTTSLPPDFGGEIEVSAEIDFPNDKCHKPGAGANCVEKPPTTAVAKARLKLTLSFKGPPSINIMAQLMMKLRGDVQAGPPIHTTFKPPS